MTWLSDSIVNFTTVFLGLLFAAVPFLLLGTLASGLVEVFVRRENLLRVIPRNPLAAIFVAGLMGFAFPVCECGVVPLTRRLFKKGLPVSAGITFLLAAPIVNPIVLISTYTAYGAGRVLIMRFVLGFLIAGTVGLIFSFNERPLSMLAPQAVAPFAGGVGDVIPLAAVDSLWKRLTRVLVIAGEEFFEMGRYLVLGAMLAALMQTAIPQSALLAVGAGPVSSVVALLALAFILSVCSTVDAFLSLAFVNTFTTGSILSFLVFGPMVDIKSTAMFLGVFQKKIVFYLVLLPLLMTMLVSIFINLNLSW